MRSRFELRGDRIGARPAVVSRLGQRQSMHACCACKLPSLWAFLLLSHGLSQPTECRWRAKSHFTRPQARARTTLWYSPKSDTQTHSNKHSKHSTRALSSSKHVPKKTAVEDVVVKQGSIQGSRRQRPIRMPRWAPPRPRRPAFAQLRRPRLWHWSSQRPRSSSRRPPSS